jgi:hypothetical protein
MEVPVRLRLRDAHSARRADEPAHGAHLFIECVCEHIKARDNFIDGLRDQASELTIRQ